MNDNLSKRELTAGLTLKAAKMVIDVVNSRKKMGFSASKTGIVSEAVINYYKNDTRLTEGLGASGGGLSQNREGGL
jgi:hypothetical protein